MQKPLNTRGGFTILELLFALAIFSVGMLSIMAMQMTATGCNTGYNFFETATGLARARVEEFRSLPWDHPVLGDGGGNAAAGLDEEGAALADGFRMLSVGGKIYEMSWNIAEDFPAVEIKTIRVIVRWNDSTSRRIFLDCLKSRSEM